MREKCSCGASIRTIWSSRVTNWRTNHHHPGDEPEQFEHRDNDGTLIIPVDQPRYIGFRAEGINNE